MLPGAASVELSAPSRCPLPCAVYIFRGPSRSFTSDGITKDFDDSQTRVIRDKTDADVFAGMSFIVRRHTYNIYIHNELCYALHPSYPERTKRRFMVHSPVKE